MSFHQVKATTVQSLKAADTSYLALQYFKVLLKCAKTTQNIWFFNQCQKHQLTPRYMKLKTQNTSPAAIAATKAGITKWIQQDRKLQYSKRDSFNIYGKVIHTELLNRLHRIEFDIFDSNTRERIQQIIHKKFSTQKKKLQSLLKNKPIRRTQTNFTDHKFFSRFINLSSTTFTEQENKLLEKGFKHNIETNFSIKQAETLGIESEIALKQLSHNTVYKYQISESIKKEFLTNTANSIQNLNIIKKIQNKTKEKEIIFTKADKGNTVIAIDKKDYINKTLEFINTGIYQTLEKDPTSSFHKEIKQTIDNTASIITDLDKYKLHIMNPQAPQLYSLIKLHKPGYPVRPVVSYMSAPAYKLSSFLINVINKHCNFVSQHSIKNSYELIDKIKNLNLPSNAKLVSFDVQNLFPSIPPEDTIKLVDKLLNKNNTNPVIRSDIIEVLKICLKQNYFSFNNKFYISKKGLIMGCPLSPLLAEIFMNSLELKIQDTLSKQFIYWYRYVDDVIACFTGTQRQLKTFLDYINSLHNNIKFTMEEETLESLNFLDLKITRLSNKHTFSIYHKPSHTDTTIHNTSRHPQQHKLAAYHSFTHRLTTVPLSETDFNNELNIIKQIALNNGYSPLLIDNMVNKKLKNRAISEIFPTTKEKLPYKTLTFYGNPSIKIRKIFNHQNINIAFKTEHSIGSFIKNYKKRTDKNNKSGVYELTCGTCPKIYIGQTGRTFNTRINEHYRSFINRKNNSTYANHLLSENHSFDPNFKILHQENKGYKLDLKEALEINRMKNTNILLNEQTETNRSPLLNLFT